MGISSEDNQYHPAAYKCKICSYTPQTLLEDDIGFARGNTKRFLKQTFKLWKCPKCLSIHSIEPVDCKDIYSDYPLNHRKLDTYAKGTYVNLLKRLIKAGLAREDQILDYGCGNGIFIQFMKEKGYQNIAGWDPYLDEYSALPESGRRFEWVIANDVIEHCEEPFEMMRHALSFVKPNGHIYVGTADSQDVDMKALKEHITRLHLPFHRVIINQAMLLYIGLRLNLEPKTIYLRSYMDTLRPFSNYRFLDEYSKALGHDLDRAIDPSNATIVIKKPKLLFYAFFGYFFPSANEPAVIWHYGSEDSKKDSTPFR